MSAHQKFIVWDWNGTLLNDTDVVVVALNALMSKVNRPALSADFFRDRFIYPLESFYGTLGISEEEVAILMGAGRDIFHDTYESLVHGISLHHGAVEILQALQKNNVTSLIVSNHIVSEIIKLLKHHNIDHHFDEVIAYINRGKQFRDETKGEKLHRYVKEKGLNGQNAIIIGDTMEEIEIARSLGMTSVSITGGVHAEHRLRAKQPDYVIHSLHDLKPILQEKGFIS